MIKVSVIIPAYNAAQTIGQSLESLVAQNFAEWEAIVINDGSTDETLAIATQFAAQDPRIQVITQANMGVSLARNTGIKEAKFDWLLFLDADDWILPQHLEQLTQLLERDPSLDAAYCRWLKVTPDGQSIIDREFSFQPSAAFAALACNCVLAIHCCIVRRTIVVDVGGFDASLQTCEDWDLWQRIARTGANFGSIPDALACYRMRPNSLSSDTLQCFIDGLAVITNGHSPDPRVPNPSPAYANGMPASNLPGEKLNYLGWSAGLLLGEGGDPLALLSNVQQDRDPGISPDTIALGIFWYAFLPTYQKPTAWVDLWPRLEGKIKEFLTALEAQSMAPALNRRVCQRLENLILDYSIAPRPLTIGSTYAVCVEVTEPILDITAPATLERLNCAVQVEGKELGKITLPIFDGFVSSYVLQDAIAAKFAWKILGHFFERTIYPELTIKSSSTGCSVWRGSLCLADNLPENEPEFWTVAHDYIGWTVFLQELWGRPDWEKDFFYDPKFGQTNVLQILKKSIKNLLLGNGKFSQSRIKDHTFLNYAKEGKLTVEVSEDLPTVSVNTQQLLATVTVGRVPLANIPIKVEGNRVSPQQLRAVISKESSFELAVVAVREGLLGRSFAGATLRDRLFSKPAQFSIENSQLDEAKFSDFSQDLKNLSPTRTEALNSPPSLVGKGAGGLGFPHDLKSQAKFPIQKYGSDGGVVLARHPGAIGTSVSRRAILPLEAIDDLIQAASVANEPVVKVSGVNEQPERVVYAPELIWFPATTANLSNQVELKPAIQPPPTLNLREHFETLFAQQADPWKYTIPYEQKKYEHTLEVLPTIQLDRVLELACAEGHFTVQLAPRVGSILAADISQIALERAAKRCAALENVRFQLLDLTKDPISDRFDLIVCSEVLYYVASWDELRAFARRVADALNPGGYFLTAHANLVVDEPDQPGYNWDHCFGAKGIGDTFAATEPLQLIKELWTPLYRVQLFQAGNTSIKEPEIIKLPQPTAPPPLAAADVLWNGGSPQTYSNTQAVTTHLPILMYHRVHPSGSAVNAPYRVTPEAFAEQLQYLRDAGFYSVTLEQWRVAKLTKTPLPGRAVVITFDDGYQDFLDYAWPLLKNYGFSATVFLVADEIGKTNRWDSFYGEEIPLLDWSDIRKLQDEGVEFGSHSVTHRHLTALSLSDVVREGARSRAILQQKLGRTPNAFAYPYGDMDAVVQHLIGACGYVFGLSCKNGFSRFQDSLLALPRIEITGSDGLGEFVAKLYEG